MPSAENGVVGAKAHAPVVHAAVPFCVLAPVIATDTVGFTPAAVVHAPPRVVTVVLVVYGNVRAVPLTVVSVTVGAAGLMVVGWGPRVPGLVAGSVWEGGMLYVAFAAGALREGEGHAPAPHGAVTLYVPFAASALEKV